MPSGLNATLLTVSSWPRKSCPIGLPVTASHNRIVLSVLADTMRALSGLNATSRAMLDGSWPVSGSPIDLAGCRVPQLDAASAGGGDPGAIRAEGQARDDGAVDVHRLPDRLPGGRVPHPDRPVHTGRGYAAAVRAERNRSHPVVVATQRLPDRLPGGGIPQPHGLVGNSRHDPGAVRAERRARHRLRNVDHLEQVTLLIQRPQQRIRLTPVLRRDGRAASNSCMPSTSSLPPACSPASISCDSPNNFCAVASRNAALASLRASAALRTLMYATTASTIAATHTIARAAESSLNRLLARRSRSSSTACRSAASANAASLVPRGRHRRRFLFLPAAGHGVAHDAREHIVRQFDPFRAVVFLEPQQPRADQPTEFVVPET